MEELITGIDSPQPALTTLGPPDTHLPFTLWMYLVYRLCRLGPSVTLNRPVGLVAAGLVRLRLRGPTSAVASAAWLTAVAAVFN